MPTKSKSDSTTYTKPEIRESIKKKVKAGSKGAEPDQWSARKTQLVATEYEKQGGGYKTAPGKEQENLKKLGAENSPRKGVRKTPVKKKTAARKK